ncbi:MAG: FAD-dependent oxidoreductase [Clostridiales bacterium]|nr:FAD-dependent oxidoreductase [Clostridiales bacterium]
MKKYVIIGGGIASLGCIDGIRANDTDGTITLICGEDALPYSRPLISYYLEDKTTMEKMNYRSEEFYKSSGVDIKRGVKAEKIEGSIVICDNGEKIPFDKLLVAAGSSPFVPPIAGAESVKNKFTFMTEEDTLALEKAAKKDSEVLIIGAGLIGLKCAEGLKARVKKITVCDLADRVLSSILDKECAALVEEKLKENGINLMLSDSAESFCGNTAKMKSGKTVDFDILVMAVGVRPNTGLLKDIGADVNRGVLVNDKMETTAENIYAAGDLVESRDISSGTDKIMAILPNAYMGGFCAGSNMAGAEKTFDNQIPMNSIGFFGYHIMTAGSYDGELYEEKSGDSVKKLFIKDNHLAGFIFLGDAVEKAGIYTSLIRNKTPLDTIDFETIKKFPSLLPFSCEYRRKNLGGVL